MYFLFEDYIYTLNRRRLKDNAVSNVNIYNIEAIEAGIYDTNITEHSQFETNGSDLWNEQCGTNIVTDNKLQSKISSDISEISINNLICVETGAFQQNIQNNSINETINRSSTSKISRSILASITRQSYLTPKTEKIYKEAIMLAKQKPDERKNS